MQLAPLQLPLVLLQLAQPQLALLLLQLAPLLLQLALLGLQLPWPPLGLRLGQPLRVLPLLGRPQPLLGQHWPSHQAAAHSHKKEVEPIAAGLALGQGIEFGRQCVPGTRSGHHDASSAWVLE